MKIFMIISHIEKLTYLILNLPLQDLTELGTTLLWMDYGYGLAIWYISFQQEKESSLLEMMPGYVRKGNFKWID